MIFCVEWMEHTTRRVYVEAPDADTISEVWAEQYDSNDVDAMENASSEVDGGIDWDSLTIDECNVTSADVVLES